MKSHLIAGLAGLTLIALAGPATAAPAPATPKLQFVPGLAVYNAQEAVAGSNAFKAANQERQTTYKTQIDAAQARQAQLNAQLTPLAEKYNRDRQAGNVSQSALQQQAQAIQNMRQAGQQELQNLLAPVTRSQAYVQQQINDVFNLAVSNAMNKQGVTFVVPMQAGVFFNGSGNYNLNPAIVAALNALLPTARLVPPESWQPGQPIPAQ